MSHQLYMRVPFSSAGNPLAKNDLRHCPLAIFDECYGSAQPGEVGLRKCYQLHPEKQEIAVGHVDANRLRARARNLERVGARVLRQCLGGNGHTFRVVGCRVAIR